MSFSENFKLVDKFLQVARYLFMSGLSLPRFNSVAKFSPTKLNQTEFLTNKGINSYLFTEGALDFSPIKSLREICYS